MTAVGYTSGDERKLNVAGGTMTGDLVLASSTPPTDLSAASKAFVLTNLTTDLAAKASIAKAAGLALVLGS